ncbi:MAG: DNA repair protein RecN [Desulfatiglandaceae bacterium]
MLVHLSISNFAIIRHLEIDLKPGLNILSGETGAGKSIIINAMNLILGGRASADLIRSGSKEAKVDALFSFPENEMLSLVLMDLGVPFDGELLINRTLFREGRNKIFINGSMATLQMLNRVGTLLISISGQHEHQLLLKQDNHLVLLDDFGGLSDERQKLTEVFNQHQTVREEINALEDVIGRIGERRDLTEFQIREIESAQIDLGEDDRLAEEKRRLQHAVELLAVVTEGYQGLYERNDSALSSVSQCLKRVTKGAEIDPGLGFIKEALAEIELKLEDAAFALRDYEKQIHMDPLSLERVEDRLEVLNGIKRKYGPTLEDVLRYRNKLASMIYDMGEKKNTLDQLRKKQAESEALLCKRAGELSEKRKAAAKVLERAVETELFELHMAETRFHVHFGEAGKSVAEPREIHIDAVHDDGIDRVEFMISPNIGEDLKPLGRIASGGELSRIMLALKTILARRASVETIIFDEVDSGISGATAEVIGEKLSSLAEYHQIVCITHLPQIASQGENHFLVRKEVVKGRTQTRISGLEPEARVQEIARLLGGKEITLRAVAHAREMLG